MASAKVFLIADTRGFHTGMKRAKWEAMDLAQKMTAIGGGMKQVGRSMTQYVTLPVLAIGAASTVMALKYDKAMHKIAALAGASTEEMALFREEILKISPAVGKAPEELAAALYLIRSSGLKGAEALDVLTQSGRAATSGLGETKIIADALTSAINAYGPAAITATRAVDVMIASVREGKMPAEAFAGSLGTVLPVAAKLKVKFDEVGAAIASMSRIGQTPESSGHALTQMLVNLLKPTASGAETMKKVGTSYEKVRQEIVDKGLLVAMVHLNEAMEGSSTAAATIFSRRGLTTFFTLTDPKRLAKTAKLFDAVTGSTGSLEKAWGIMSEDSAVRLDMALASLKSALIKIGDIMIPVVVRIAEDFANLADSFSRLSDNTKKWIVYLALAAAAAGPLLRVVGSVAQIAGWQMARSAAAKSAAASAASAGAVAASGGGIVAGVASAAPYLAAVAAVAALAYGMYKLDKAMHPPIATAEEMKAALDAVTADTTGRIEAWSEKKLGGHYIVEKGELVWRPKFQVDIPNVSVIVGDRFRAAAEEQRKLAEKSLTDLENVTKTRAQEIRDALEQLDAQLTAASHPGRFQFSVAGLEGMQLQRSQLQTELDKILAVKESFFERWAKIGKESESKQVMATVKDVKTAIAGTRAELAKFPKTPTTVKMALQETRAKKRLAELRGQLKDVVKQNYEVVITARIEKAKTKVDDLQATLKGIRKGGVTTAEIGIFDKTKAALVKAQGRLDVMAEKKNEITVTANTNPALLAAQTLHEDLRLMFEDPLTQIIKVVKEGEYHSGGIASGPSSGYSATLHGREAILPLDHPNLIPGILAQAGIIAAASRITTTAAPRGVGARDGGDLHLHIHGGVWDLDDITDYVEEARAMRAHRAGYSAAA